MARRPPIHPIITTLSPPWRLVLVPATYQTPVSYYQLPATTTHSGAAWPPRKRRYGGGRAKRQHRALALAAAREVTASEAAPASREAPQPPIGSQTSLRGTGRTQPRGPQGEGRFILQLPFHSQKMIERWRSRFGSPQHLAHEVHISKPTTSEHVLPNTPYEVAGIYMARVLIRQVTNYHKASRKLDETWSRLMAGATVRVILILRSREIALCIKSGASRSISKKGTSWTLTLKYRPRRIRRPNNDTLPDAPCFIYHTPAEPQGQVARVSGASNSCSLSKTGADLG
jgi:hypothetical protein